MGRGFFVPNGDKGDMIFILKALYDLYEELFLAEEKIGFHTGQFSNLDQIIPVDRAAEVGLSWGVEPVIYEFLVADGADGGGWFESFGYFGIVDAVVYGAEDSFLE